MDVTKIVITGGPCAGKTTALSWIMNSFTEKGYVVLIVPELGLAAYADRMIISESGEGSPDFFSNLFYF